MIVVCSLCFFSCLFHLSCISDVYVGEACLVISTLGTCTFGVILLNLKFRNVPLCLQFCLLLDFVWCLILRDGLLIPHLLLLWNLLLMTCQVFSSFLKWILIKLFGWIIFWRKLKYFFESLAIKPLTLLIVSNVVYLIFLHLGVLCGCVNVESPTHLLLIILLLNNFWISFWRLLDGLLLFSTIFFTYLPPSQWATRFLAVKMLFGWLFFEFSFRLYRTSIMSISSKIIFPLLLIFLTLYCPWLLIDAKLGTILRTLAYMS